MKSLLSLSLLLPLALASAVPRAEQKVDYSGYKVLRVTSAKKNFEAQVEKLAAHVLNPGKAEYLDLVVAPENVKAVKALGESTVVTEDVGAALAEEEDGTVSAYAGMLIPAESVQPLLI